MAEALAHLGRAPVDVVLSDLRMPGADGLELVRRMQTAAPDVPVVILTGHGNVASAVECLKAGASDYILKPAEPEALEVALDRALEGRALRREVRYLRSAVAAQAEVAIGESAPWRRVMGMVEAAAAADSVVLFTGESGTGKELLARRLHALSSRAAGPFVKVNCAAVPLEMWESEFFGHRKGSFAGAATDREGRFQLAHRGTLLLDEVGAMPPAGQAKLLRAIQDGEFERLGDEQATRVDVRVVASTNSDLEAEVQQGRFRADLFYSLNVVRIDVPPLRERRDDIPLLARHFADQVAQRLGRPSPDLAAGRAGAPRGLPLARQRPRAAQRDRAGPDPRPRRAGSRASTWLPPAPAPLRGKARPWRSGSSTCATRSTSSSASCCSRRTGGPAACARRRRTCSGSTRATSATTCASTTSTPTPPRSRPFAGGGSRGPADDRSPAGPGRPGRAAGRRSP